MSRRGLFCLVLVASLLLGVGVVKSAEPTVSVVYFRGDGCTSCARTDPFVLVELPRVYGGKFVVVEYEVFHHPYNAEVMLEYNATYGIGLTVPLIILDVDDFLVDLSILAELRGKVDTYLALGGNELPLANGSSVAFEDLNVEDLPGSAKIWTGNRYSPLEAPTVLAVLVAAVVDAVNPCAFAVLIILLSGVIASGGRNKALKAGLAFIVAVFVMYLLMGFGIFSISMAPGIAYYFYKAVGVFALIVGVLNMKDYFWESATGVLSSVPDSWRPKIQKLLDDVTSVPGALISGFAVSLFLLPCTSGPYLVVLGLLAHETTNMYVIQLLLLYNFVFVLPMIGIVLAVYFGLTTTAKAARWRHRKIRLLHLIAGAVMFCMGIWMLFFYQ
jgi:cytochrome c biogenesis protein CcdA